MVSWASSFWRLKDRKNKSTEARLRDGAHRELGAKGGVASTGSCGAVHLADHVEVVGVEQVGDGHIVVGGHLVGREDTERCEERGHKAGHDEGRHPAAKHLGLDKTPF